MRSHTGRTRGRRFALAAIAVGAALLVVPACGDDGDEAGEGGGATSTTLSDFSGYTRSPAPSVADVTFPLADGSAQVAMPADPGGLRIVYFGYTSCPDVCPTTMSDLKRALAELPADQRDLVQVDMITVDPGRDVPEKIHDYVTTFIADGQALRTEDPELLRSTATAFGADYSVETTAEGEVEVEHTAELYAVDDTGHIVMVWPFGTPSADLAHDLGRLLEGDRPEDQTSGSTTESTATG